MFKHLILVGVSSLEDARSGRDFYGGRLTAGQRAFRGTLGSVELVGAAIGLKAPLNGAIGRIEAGLGYRTVAEHALRAPGLASHFRVAPSSNSPFADRLARVAARTPEEVASRLARANDLRRVRDGIPSRLYHYTDEAGQTGITGSQQLRPSLRAVNPKDARYGDGQYLSDIAPGTRTPAQLSRAFIGQPFQGRRFTNFVEVDVSGLHVVRGRDGVFVVPNGGPLDLSGRILRSGGN